MCPFPICRAVQFCGLCGADLGFALAAERGQRAVARRREPVCAAGLQMGQCSQLVVRGEGSPPTAEAASIPVANTVGAKTGGGTVQAELSEQAASLLLWGRGSRPGLLTGPGCIRIVYL